MTYVVTDNCIACKYTDCVEVCPVDCFYEGENMLVINPDECIDCGVCEPECPIEAIIPDNLDEGTKWLLANLPFYSRWYRFLLFYPGSDQLLDSLFIDPSWKAREDSINQQNDEMRKLFTEAMLAQISDQSLIDRVIPNYPPFGKRMLQDNGSWLEALHLPNVHLLLEGVECMNSK